MENNGDGNSATASAAARLIRSNETEIIAQWLDRVIAEIPTARKQSRAEIANHLVELLENLACAVTKLAELDPARVRKMKFINASSKVHGRDRASFENYTVGDVLHEYIILRQVMTSLCSMQGSFDRHAADVINQAIEFSGLAAVDEFVRVTEEVQQKLIGSLVHDVRTPLGVAHTFVELLLQPSVSEEIRKQAKTTISRNLQRAVAMLEDLLDFMKVRGGIGLFLHFQEMDINIPLRNVVIEANKIYSAEVQYLPEKRPVMGVFDEALVVRCVENLISNAIKHGTPNSPVTMRLQDHGDHISIRIHNEGDCISEEDIGAIFESFTQVKRRAMPRARSWGLGLTLIKTVTQSHGGQVIIESSAEQGTTFGMTLYKRHRANGEEEVVRI